MLTINERVKYVRQCLQLSQAQFAKALSMSNGYIAGIEINKNKVNDRIIKLICYTFNVNMEWLKNGTGDVFMPNNNFLELASSSFKKLKPEYQQYIINQIDQLLEIQHSECDKKKNIT